MVSYIADTFYQKPALLPSEISYIPPLLTEDSIKEVPAFAKAVESEVQPIGYNPYPESLEARDWVKAFQAEAEAIGYLSMNESWLTSWFAAALLQAFESQADYNKGYDDGLNDGQFLEAYDHQTGEKITLDEALNQILKAEGIIHYNV